MDHISLGEVAWDMRARPDVGSRAIQSNLSWLYLSHTLHCCGLRVLILRAIFAQGVACSQRNPFVPWRICNQDNIVEQQLSLQPELVPFDKKCYVAIDVSLHFNRLITHLEKCGSGNNRMGPLASSSRYLYDNVDWLWLHFLISSTNHSSRAHLPHILFPPATVMSETERNWLDNYLCNSMSKNRQNMSCLTVLVQIEPVATLPSHQVS